MEVDVNKVNIYDAGTNTLSKNSDKIRLEFY